MGLCIHYSGSFNTEYALQKLIEEVEDVAKVHKWKYNIFLSDFPTESTPVNHLKLYGIAFTPPGCETVSVCFLNDCRMCSIAHPFLAERGFFDDEDEDSNTISVKTQYAGIEVHAILINLFRHLSKTYLKDFKMYDEGELWEKEDMANTQKIFNRYNYIVDSFAERLQGGAVKEGESLEDFIKRIAGEMHRGDKDKLKP